MEDNNENDFRCSDAVLAWAKATLVTGAATAFTGLAAPTATPVVAALALFFCLNALRTARKEHETFTSSLNKKRDINVKKTESVYPK